MPNFSTLIIRWYTNNHRQLPWRETKNPYYIWLSEIILQQTRVDQGLPYYFKFIKQFPDIKSLADAKEEEILKLWQGLGYYSRARNLHTTAKIICEKYGGIFPNDYNTILSLKGIGEYTAAAISSFAYDLPYAVSDGNVQRFLSRYFLVTEPINSTAGKKIINQLATENLDRKNPGIYNQAIMEFGARQCTPAKPDCVSCPLSSSCLANAKKMTSVLPSKTKKQKSRNRYFEYLVIENDNELLIKKREGNDIWKNLYDFPLIEYSELKDPAAITVSEEWSSYFKKSKLHIRKISPGIKHILSHQIIHARFWHIKPVKELKLKNTLQVSQKKLNDYPLPRLIDRYLTESV